MRLPVLSILLAASCAAPALAQAPAVQRVEAGNRTSENIPEIPRALIDRLNRYQNTRGASAAGWTRDGCLVISTRFAETSQVHRVCQPLGMREQLTFYPEPVSGVDVAPAASGRDGFVFGKDVGGNEFAQLYWFDLATRETTLLTDGQRTRNGGALFSDDGRQLAYNSNARNGTDTDLWLMDMATREAKPLVTAGGNWSAMDFSPDGKRLLVLKYVSANESYPGEVDLATGKLTMFPVDGGKAAFGGFAFAGDGQSVFYVSDEPFEGRDSEFQTLRFHDPAAGAFRELTGDIPWDVEGFRVSDDGRHLAYVTNEGGLYKLHVLALPSMQPVALPQLPPGLAYGLHFSPDGKRLAVTVNTATSPSDVFVVDLERATLAQWTRSEVGGLDTSTFVAPELVHFPTFDRVDGKPRMIPAFYYRPPNAPAGGKYPVVIDIHGGPEGQSVPYFDPYTQFLMRELGVAVLVPNVRGSAGYGKSYLKLDNGDRREDSVRDI